MTCRADPPTLSFLLPVRNAQVRIEPTVLRLLACGDDLTAQGSVTGVRVLVVDDGSTDATVSILERIAASDRRVTLLLHSDSQGIGSALRTGFRSVTTDLVFCTDAGHPVHPSTVATALDLLGTHDADVVSAYRRRRYVEGPRTLLCSLTYNSMVQATLGLRVRDVNFAAKLLRRDVIDEMVLESRGAFIDAELLARAARRGRRIVQFPADHHHRDAGATARPSVATVRDMLADMISLRPQIRNEHPRRLPR